LYNGSHLLDAKVSGTYILKNGTKTIAELAFFDSYMDILYIPESVKYIGNAGLYNINYKNTHFKVVEGSYAEQYAIEHNYPYSYFNPSDIYG